MEDDLGAEGEAELLEREEGERAQRRDGGECVAVDREAEVAQQEARQRRLEQQRLHIYIICVAAYHTYLIAAATPTYIYNEQQRRLDDA